MALEYLPRPREKNRPNARGGSITIEPQAPSKRLDLDLQVDALLIRIKKMNFKEVLDALGIRKLKNADPSKPMTTKSITAT
jgi:hypothetical protein